MASRVLFFTIGGLAGVIAGESLAAPAPLKGLETTLALSNLTADTSAKAQTLLKTKLAGVKGVTAVTLRPKEGKVLVKHDATVKPKALEAVVVAAGFKVVVPKGKAATDSPTPPAEEPWEDPSKGHGDALDTAPYDEGPYDGDPEGDDAYDDAYDEDI